MILEGLVTTLNPDASPHLAPMGPLVDESLDRLVFRPFRESHTFQNLFLTRHGIFHLTDNVELLARAAVHRLQSPPAMRTASGTPGMILEDACRWFAFRVDTIDQSQDRTRLECTVFERGWIRDFVGFNRAKHAVLEAAILATRIHLYDPPYLRSEFARLRTIVQKTAGDQEQRAFEFLDKYLTERLGEER